jgi:ABC-type uncharacterized transport system substrate-binding protein
VPSDPTDETVVTAKPTSLKHAQQLRVPVMPEDKRVIEANAADVGLSVAAYLRELGLRRVVPSVLDHRAVAELARVAADQGRLGGLLKLFLTMDDKLEQLGGQRDLRARVVVLLQRIGETQKALEAVMQRVVR